MKTLKNLFITFFTCVYVFFLSALGSNVGVIVVYLVPPSVFVLLGIFSTICFAITTFKIGVALNKKTFVIMFYTIWSLFPMANLIPFIGLLADVNKTLKETE